MYRGRIGTAAMNSLRDSLASSIIPGALSNLIGDSGSVSSATPTTDDDTPYHSDKSLPIPAALVKEQWRLIFTSSDATAVDLEVAIAHCRDLVLLTEECSEERRWLVRHLVDLRYMLKELTDTPLRPGEVGGGYAVKTVVGHHFAVHQRKNNLYDSLQAASVRHYCDHCSSIIWSVVQEWYICNDCGYLAHQKCVESVVRVCAHIVVTERPFPIADICPEIGLAEQGYRCAECGRAMNFKNAWIEPRLCDYSGRYYCPTCHWNDSATIPARMVHNWDFGQRKVGRASLQELKLFADKPLIKLEETNPKLFVFLKKLSTLKKLRENLVHMRKYLIECRQAADDKLLEMQMDARRHLIQSSEYYSIVDLEQTESGALEEHLHKVFGVFDRHIRGCQLCTARAYICEICSNVEVIYPFDDGCIICTVCNSIFHRVCMTRKNMVCPKCVRRRKRKAKLKLKRNKQLSDDNDGHDEDFNDEDDDADVDDGDDAVVDADND